MGAKCLLDIRVLFTVPGVCAALMVCGPATWADDDALSRPLFASADLLEVILIGPISTTLRDLEKREERDFRLRVDDRDYAVEVRVRGKSRSRREICIFPPLRLRFRDAEGLFAGQQKIKMVTHCKNSDAGEADVMEEFLAYRILNLLTPDSFRVRPLRVTYVDSDGRLSKRARLRHAFLIESKSELETRRGGKVIKTTQLSLAQLDAMHAAIVYVFQYMIGNTDWSLVTATGEDDCCHNGRTLKVGDWIRYVPFDFDLAGLVNTPYAKPDPGLHLRSVRVRRYRGFCMDQHYLRTAVEHVKQQEQKIYELVRSTPGLNNKQQRTAVAYLAGFFDEARSGRFVPELAKHCLRPGG